MYRVSNNKQHWKHTLKQDIIDKVKPFFVPLKIFKSKKVKVVSHHLSDKIFFVIF